MPIKVWGSRAEPCRAQATNPAIDLSAFAADSLEVGLAAAFGNNSDPLCLNLGNMRPVLLGKLKASALVVKPKSDAIPRKQRPATGTSFAARSPAAAWGPCSRGRDVDLGRDLAVKVLLEKYADQPEVVRRFIEEAQIGGQLAAPGRRAGLRHRPLRRPAVLRHEAGQGPDPGGAPGRARPTRPRTCRGS